MVSAEEQLLAAFVPDHDSLVFLDCARENQSQRLRRVNALVELFLQRAFGFDRQIRFLRFFPRELR
jgi:hypothetical protein